MPTDRSVVLSWLGSGRAYQGRSAGGGPTIFIDGENEHGPSPMDTLLLGVAACMGIDIQEILRKSRVRLDELDFHVSGARAADHPRRYTRIDFDIVVTGPGPGNARRVERAVELSRDKYCSALNSLQPDIEITMRIRNRTPASATWRP
jgi:putative redox protein